MSDLQFEEWLVTFRNRVRDSRFGDTDDDGGVALKPSETAFTQTFVEDLQDLGQVPDLEYAYLKRKIGPRNAWGKLNAYGISEDDGRVDLVVVIHEENPDSDLRSVPASDISAATKRALHVFASVAEPIHDEMEPSSSTYDMIERLNEFYLRAGAVRLVVLVDGEVKKIPEFEKPTALKNLNINIDIWHLERLFRAASSGLTYESVTINLVERLGKPLPCISSERAAEDHHCHLASFPGGLLHDLYHEYGARLLELNVRSFLQARGKVNRGIRDTLQNDPGHFLAYNNGISATVEDLDLVKNPDGSSSIRSMTGLQIVNGGQTIASIHRAKDRDGADLSGVQVQAKITEVKPKYLDELVPYISRYSNTQNKVNETDFSANHPFHVGIQRLSEQVWAPGETSRWFYERARGQWEVARVREGTTPARKKTFDQKTPRRQRVDKVLLAKSVNTWNRLPYVVSQGGQKNFVHFMTAVEKKGTGWEPGEKYYKNLIARVIIHKRAEKIARQHAFSAYRANAVSYTIALIAYRTAGRINLHSIWEQQDVSEALEQTIRDWMPLVHEEIVDSAGERNVTEWCKKKECWSYIQSLNLKFETGLEEELNEGQPLPNVGKFKKGADGQEAVELTQEEKDRQARVLSLSKAEFINMIEWGSQSDEVSGFLLGIASTVLAYALNGWVKVPSPKQTNRICEILDAWENSGEAGKGDED